MTTWQTIRYWFYRATGQRRRAGGILAAANRRSRFVASASRGESPAVVINNEVAS